jgi:hypothetical protein
VANPLSYHKPSKRTETRHIGRKEFGDAGVHGHFNSCAGPEISRGATSYGLCLPMGTHGGDGLTTVGDRPLAREFTAAILIGRRVDLIAC